MTDTICLRLSLACIAASALLAGCVVDDSMPTRPRTANFLTPDTNAQESAEKRTLENADHPVPDSRKELPGSKATLPADDQVITADVTADSTTAHVPGVHDIDLAIAKEMRSLGYLFPLGWDAWGHTVAPMTVYNRDTYPKSIPHLPVNPGTVPLAGSTPAPDGDWDIDNSWGQGLVLENYPHRPWPETKVFYDEITVEHNPIYYFDLQQHLNVKQPDGGYVEDMKSDFYEVPWFFAQTVALPVLMLLEPPLAHRTTDRQSADPNFRGHLPDGPTVPVTTPGGLHWDYPFLNPDGTVKQPGPLTEPAR